MTVDNEQQVASQPKPQPIPIHSSVNVSVGEPRYEKLSEPCDEMHHNEHGHPPFHGPPPHVRKFMRKRFKRICCCLSFLILLNLMVACYIAKKVNYISLVLSPDSDLKYMPGGFHPFCSDLCVDLCASSESENSLDCDVSDCVDACGSHFISMDSDISSDSVSVSTDNAMQLDQSNDEQVESSSNMQTQYQGQSQSHSHSGSHTHSKHHRGDEKKPSNGGRPYAPDKDGRTLRGPRFMRK